MSGECARQDGKARSLVAETEQWTARSWRGSPAGFPRRLLDWPFGPGLTLGLGPPGLSGVPTRDKSGDYEPSALKSKEHRSGGHLKVGCCIVKDTALISECPRTRPAPPTEPGRGAREGSSPKTPR